MKLVLLLGFIEERVLKSYDDFVTLVAADIQWPESDVRRLLTLHLERAHLTEQHIVLYINYPDYTVLRLAQLLGLTPGVVKRAIHKVQKAFPGLRLDTMVQCRDECPALEHMGRIELSSSFDDRLNGDRVTKF